MVGGAVGALALALTSSWPVAWLAFAIEAGLGSMWNVITVSLRQAIIPDHLLGRVNSVYRFLGWGMMPIGSLRRWSDRRRSAIGQESRELALRLPYVVALVGNLLLLAFGSRRLTTAKIEAARAAGKAPSTQPRVIESATTRSAQAGRGRSADRPGSWRSASQCPPSASTACCGQVLGSWALNCGPAPLSTSRSLGRGVGQRGPVRDAGGL